ncbi:TIGR03013 family PEP-CTERM/XrtA system glycosyltransferase [Geobacter hydrogenophilus]|uniref:Glycosyl transferase n=1 Tax=Geobacter hydrogenophilus TaxID=40983 RepID=A0A9W6G2N8_9BACT|nr:TIGR03013 family XrtA/PEP-CTERM system glycosyltransferase [Geobacter hydrogenophilus]MBT0892909.1 TIGR03013 family PEP-CTERM/XrtA system glycosyltransferase [Geobacter hydrogenophilus]GLI39258.1 glycosyl transferase [Geobacter hydrogenophilus]
MKKMVILLITGDIVCTVLALGIAYLVRFGTVPGMESFLSLAGAVQLVLLVVAVIFSSFMVEFYNVDKDMKLRERIAHSAISLSVSFLILSAIFYLAPDLTIGRGLLAMALVILCLWQILWHLFCRVSLYHPGLARRVLVLGTGPLAREIGGLVSATNHNHVLAGYFGCTNEPIYVPSHHIVGNGDGLVSAALRERTDKIVVSLSERRGAFPLSEVLNCKFSGIEVIDAPSFYEEITGKLMIENITPSWFIFSNGFRRTGFGRIMKRSTDLVLSLVGIILVLPVLPFIALGIRITSPGPILFRQVRVGQGDRPFALYKFRSMRADAEKASGAVWAQKDDPRITRFGKFLRTSRLDELPQLYNVLRGDMSLVGPRPERPEFVDKLKEVIPYYSERHFVKPGVTGWAQVKYPYGASVDDAIEKLRYDLYYIKNMSMLLDIIIVLETIKVVLFGRGSR